MSKENEPSKIFPHLTLGKLVVAYRVNASGMMGRWPVANRKAIEKELSEAGLLPDLKAEDRAYEEGMRKNLGLSSMEFSALKKRLKDGIIISSDDPLLQEPFGSNGGGITESLFEVAAKAGKKRHGQKKK